MLWATVFEDFWTNSNYFSGQLKSGNGAEEIISHAHVYTYTHTHTISKHDMIHYGQQYAGLVGTVRESVSMLNL